VRLGSKSADEFIQILNKKNEIIQQDLLTKIIELTKTVDVKVMMGIRPSQNKKHLILKK